MQWNVNNMFRPLTSLKVNSHYKISNYIDIAGLNST